MSENKYNFQALTPTNQADIEVYEDALDYVFDNQDIKNVGICGAYGSGKSSVMQTYESKRTEQNFIYISLSYFQTPAGSEVRSTSSEELISCEKELEGKIINQLIHQIDKGKIIQTNFKVKTPVEPKRVWKYSFLLIVLISFIIYGIFFDNWRNYVEQSSQKNFSALLSFSTMPVFRFVIGICCIAILFYFIYKCVKLQLNNNWLKGISIHGNTFEIFEQSNESYFDKYLNEVIYLFENSQANAIVFEDLDRYEITQIFQRLREINILVNNRRKKQSPLRFFYLVRDDIFVSKERTKFFDFILPIVPVLDSSNSCDQIIAHFESEELSNLFEIEFLREISLFIDDMRILKNIYNEFLIYYKKLNDAELDSKKLFSIMIYKNIFPKDFSQLQLGRGFVHTVLAEKDILRNKAIAACKTEIRELKDKIQRSEAEHLKLKEELASIYEPKIKELEETCGKDVEYQKLSDEYDEKQKRIESQEKSDKENSEEKIRQLEAEIAKLKSQTKICELINDENAETVFKVKYINEVGDSFDFKDIKSSDYFPLIKYLIRKGHIDETYADYMTYFYEKSLKLNDKIFLRRVIGGEKVSPTSSLDNPQLVISWLSEDYFKRKEILRLDLVGCLFDWQSETGELQEISKKPANKKSRLN